MVTLAYAHDGANEYDLLFLDYLVKKNVVYLLTFYRNPRFVPRKTAIMRMPKIFCAPTEKAEGPYMYALFPLRALLLRLYLKLIKPQVVLGCMATKYGFYIAVSRFKPFILIIWGSDILVAPKRFFLFRFMAKYAIKSADAVVIDSEVQRKTAIQLGCSPEKILEFPWFDLKDINVYTSKSTIRDKLGWHENPIVVSTRKHELFYGVQYFIEAIPKVVNTLPEARFLIVGRGRLTERLKRRVKELGIEKYVRFMGYLPREDAIACVNASDVYVSTSFSDGTSASLLEAMALGVPSVVTDIPGNKEWIKDGWNGYLVPVKDPKSLAEKIVQLIRDKEVGERLGENARNTVENKVNWRKNMKSFSDLIVQLASKKL